MPINWAYIDHFEEWEFDDPNYPGSGSLIDGQLLMLLVKIRRELNCPVIPHGPVGGCVDVDGRWGHAPESYHLKEHGCRAVDFHLVTDLSSREQYYHIARYGFPGLGVYYDWHWNNKPLPIGFHGDLRPRDRTQRWARINGHYLYLLAN